MLVALGGVALLTNEAVKSLTPLGRFLATPPSQRNRYRVFFFHAFSIYPYPTWSNGLPTAGYLTQAVAYCTMGSAGYY